MHFSNSINCTNYLRTKSFKEVQQLFEQHFRDRVSTTKMTIWKFVQKYKTEGSSLNINKDRSGRRRTDRPQKKTLIFFKKSFSKIQEYISQKKTVWTLVHLTESLNAIYGILIRKKKK